MATSPKLVGTLLTLNQDLAETTQNTLTKLLEAFTPTVSVISLATTPPGGESEGDVHVPIATATGAWVGKEGDFAIFLDSAYFFVTPVEGMDRYLQPTNRVETFEGTNWIEGLSSVSTAIAAAGSTQGAATLLTSKWNEVTTATASSADGVRLPPALAGLKLVVINAHATVPIDVFPATGDDIDGAAVNTAVTIAVAEVASFRAVDGTSWYSQVGLSA